MFMALVVIIGIGIGIGRTAPPVIVARIDTAASRLLMHPHESVGHNADDMYRPHSPTLADPDFVTGLASLNAGNVRWPGGTSSNYWDWQVGTFLSSQELSKQNLTNPCGPRNLSQVLLLEHLSTALAVGGRGAAPLFALNVLSSNLTYQMEMLEHAEGLGLPVRFAELGNELYIPTNNYLQGFPTVEQYAATAVEWADALKRRWPALTVSVPAAGSTAAACEGKPKGSPGCEPRRISWNRRLSAALNLSGATSIGAVSLHQYPGTTLPPLTNTTGCPSWGYASVAQQLHELQQLHDLSPVGGAVARMLGVPFEYALPELLAAAAELPAIPSIWVSEYNVKDECGAAQYSWGGALFTTTLSLLYLRTPKVELTTVWSLGGATGYTSLFTSNASMAGLCCNLSAPTLLNRRTAQGLLLGELSNTIGNSALLEPLAFNPNPMLSRGGDGKGMYPALLAVRFSNPSLAASAANAPRGNAASYDRGDVSVFLLNLSPTTHEVDFSAVLKASSHPSSRGADSSGPGGAAGDRFVAGCSVRQWSAPPALHYTGVVSKAHQLNFSVNSFGPAPAERRLAVRPYSATSVMCASSPFIQKPR